MEFLARNQTRFFQKGDDKEVLIESFSRATSFVSWLLAHLVRTARFIIRAYPPPVFLCFPLSACVPEGEEREEVAFMGTSYPRLEHSPHPPPPGGCYCSSNRESLMRANVRFVFDATAR